MSLASAFSSSRPLVLVGAGKMGSAMLKGWLDSGLQSGAVVVIDPKPPADSAAMLAAAGIEPVAAAPEGVSAGVIIVAVKPQIIGDVLPGLRALVGEGTIVVSIAAGATLQNLRKGIGSAAIVRAMPNTPAQVGRGITVAIGNTKVKRDARTLVDRLLSAVGDVIWVKQEEMIDSATAVSGSGPAYVFHMVEALAAAAMHVGFDEKAARQLARATVTGAAELLHQSELDAGTLRQNVTSPKGTTEAALKILMGKDGLSPLMKKAVSAARRRSRQLAK